MSNKDIEYKTVSEVAGPLMIVESIKNHTYVIHLDDMGVFSLLYHQIFFNSFFNLFPRKFLFYS